MENDRLIQELRLLQEQNVLAQNRRKSDKEGKKHSYVRPHEPRVQKELHLHFDLLGNQSVIGSPMNHSGNIPYNTRQNVPMHARQPQWDSRSFYSEPTKRPRTKVIMYRATHKNDGSVKIARTNSFIADGNPRPPFVPPLDLKKLSSPRKGRFPHLYANSKQFPSNGYHDYVKPKEAYSVLPKVPPLSRKLSHVSEGQEPESKPPTGAQLQVIDDEGEPSGSRSVSPNKRVKPDQGLAIPDTERPESDVSLHIPEINVDSARDSPEQVTSPAPNVAWQVNRTSPAAQKPLYSYEYEE